MSLPYAETTAAKRNTYTLRGLERQAVMERADYTCVYCGLRSIAYNANRDPVGPDGAVWQLDHITPVSLGGSWDASNIALSCASCNRLKGNRTIGELAAHLMSVRARIDAALANAENWPT